MLRHMAAVLCFEKEIYIEETIGNRDYYNAPGTKNRG